MESNARVPQPHTYAREWLKACSHKYDACANSAGRSMTPNTPRYQGTALAWERTHVHACHLQRRFQASWHLRTTHGKPSRVLSCVQRHARAISTATALRMHEHTRGPGRFQYVDSTSHSCLLRLHAHTSVPGTSSLHANTSTPMPTAPSYPSLHAKTTHTQMQANACMPTMPTPTHPFQQLPASETHTPTPEKDLLHANTYTSMPSTSCTQITSRPRPQPPAWKRQHAHNRSSPHANNLSPMPSRILLHANAYAPMPSNALHANNLLSMLAI